MANSVDILSFSNPVFSSYAFWGSILVIKCFLMSPWTAFFRFKNKTPASPEDMAVTKAAEMPANPNETVERIRRAHLNDMENILPFLSIGLFYVLTDPKPMVAIILFRLTTVARFLHTFVYAIYVVPQPARAICFFIHLSITLYMAIMCIIYFI